MFIKVIVPVYCPLQKVITATCLYMFYQVCFYYVGKQTECKHLDINRQVAQISLLTCEVKLYFNSQLRVVRLGISAPFELLFFSISVQRSVSFYILNFHVIRHFLKKRIYILNRILISGFYEIFEHET